MSKSDLEVPTSTQTENLSAQQTSEDLLINIVEKSTKHENKLETISKLIPQIEPERIIAIARLAAKKGYRYSALFLASEMLKHEGYKQLVSKLLYDIITNPGMMIAFMEIYWRNGVCPIAAQVKKGLSFSFTKFDEASFVKFNTKGTITLRGLMCLVHPVPKDNVQEELFKKIKEGRLTHG